MAEEQDPLVPGFEPIEEAGPKNCSVKISEVSAKVGELSDPAEETPVSFYEQVQGAYEPRFEVWVPGSDGMPVPAGESSDTIDAPAMSYEAFVCIADERQYVEVFADELHAILQDPDRSFEPARIKALGSKHTQHTPTLTVKLRPTWDNGGRERERRVFDPKRVEKRFGLTLVQLTAEEMQPQDGSHLLVRPVREQCIHYKRQLFQEAQSFMRTYRNCTARRSNGGAYLSLDDEAVYACDYRSPKDQASTDKHLDTRQRELLRVIQPSEEGGLT